MFQKIVDKKKKVKVKVKVKANPKINFNLIKRKLIVDRPKILSSVKLRNWISKQELLKKF